MTCHYTLHTAKLCLYRQYTLFCFTKRTAKLQKKRLSHKKKAESVCCFKKSIYLCIRFRETIIGNTIRKCKDGAIVYRLGREIFILKSGVRFPVALQS